MIKLADDANWLFGLLSRLGDMEKVNFEGIVKAIDESLPVLIPSESFLDDKWYDARSTLFACALSWTPDEIREKAVAIREHVHPLLKYFAENVSAEIIEQQIDCTPQEIKDNSLNLEKSLRPFLKVKAQYYF